MLFAIKHENRAPVSTAFLVPHYWFIFPANQFANIPRKAEKKEIILKELRSHVFYEPFAPEALIKSWPKVLKR